MFKSIQWKIIAIFLLLTVSVMIVVGTFLLQNISAYYYIDFSNSLDTQVFSDDVVTDFESAIDGENGVEGCLELLKVYSVRMGIDSFRNYYILDDSLNILGGSSSERESLTQRVILCLHSMESAEILPMKIKNLWTMPFPSVTANILSM